VQNHPQNLIETIISYPQFTFVKVHFSGRSMPRVLVNGEVVRTEIFPRQRAHQDPPQGREGAAGNLSIHFAGSHILRSSASVSTTRAHSPCNGPGWKRGRSSSGMIFLHPTLFASRNVKLGQSRRYKGYFDETRSLRFH